ncbi:MAG: transcriptional regulator FtsR, partial [Solirubrobacterales bacterium]
AKESAQPSSLDSERASRPRKALTIGAVCKILGQEFDDISISKIRYLEDQKLLSPARTDGGYRLYSQADVERLRAILRMQRDEFLPLRVIRQELSSRVGPDPGDGRTMSAGRTGSVRAAQGGSISHQALLDQTEASAQIVRELEEFGLLHPVVVSGDHTYNEADVEIVRAASELAQFGVEGRNLRHFATSADRESALLEQILAPGLRSRSKERREEALESLDTLVAVCSRLRHQLLLQELRRLSD